VRVGQHGCFGRQGDLFAGTNEGVGFAVDIKGDASATGFEFSYDGGPIIIGVITFATPGGDRSELKPGIKEKVMA
jgi:hypothetical protein